MRVGLSVALLMFPQALQACAVCFGKDEGGNLGRAYALAIGLLTGMTFLILGALVLAVYRLESRRSQWTR